MQLHWIDRGGKRKQYGELAPGANRRQHTFAGHVWLAADVAGKGLAVFVATKDDAVATITGLVPTPEEPKKEPKRDPRLSPDGRHRAFIRDHNVFLKEVASGTETQLSQDGSEKDLYGGFHWSPDSQKLVVLQTQKGEKHPVHMVESSPKDQLQPRLHEINYRKTGDRIALRKPRLFDVAAKHQIPVADTLFPTPWSVGHFHWLPDSSQFLFLYNQRGHQVLRLLSIDAKTGRVRTVIDETSKTFVNYSNKTYLHYLDATGEAIWMSERDGWNHLYLVELATGTVKNPITKGEWVVRSVASVDEERRELLLKVMGTIPSQDPYYVHYARVKLDGTGFTLLTEGNGTHSIEWSPQEKYFIDTYSRVDLATVKELRRASDGTLVRELTRGDLGALRKTGWQPPEPFVAKGRDGTTDIHGVIFRPTTFDPSRKYPIIEAIYAGPHGQHVPKSFAEFRGQQALAEIGFVVVQIDGMGTNWRSKAFHDVCWQNLGDAGFPDRVAWLRAAATAYPYMDIRRVGIYGGSAGGQSAMRALIAHPDVYSVAVADCGCHDNRM
ncbi:MAG: prolyl oligopeptidase family serine peptidase, partial [Victivallales bacterium]|nr:prolyl oligopeptidase family serine peptidase [Victivallales bacterium]